jgi:hypothetical protein
MSNCGVRCGHAGFFSPILRCTISVPYPGSQVGKWRARRASVLEIIEVNERAVGEATDCNVDEVGALGVSTQELARRDLPLQISSRRRRGSHSTPTTAPEPALNGSRSIVAEGSVAALPRA